MAGESDAPAPDQPFKVLYKFQNDSLIEANDEDRAEILRKFTVDLLGDAELHVAVAPREEFCKDVSKAMQHITPAIISLLKRSSNYYSFGPATFPEEEHKDVSRVMTDAGFMEGFLTFGSLLPSEVEDDGTIDEYQCIMYDEEDPRHESVKADVSLVQDTLHGNVLSAWWDESFNEMEVQAILKSSENNGNHREFFIFTEKRVYVWNFWTS